MLASYKKSLRAAFLAVFYLGLGLSAYAQSGSSTSVTGTVVDPSGAVVPQATVELHNPVSGFDRTMTTDAAGKFTFPNVSFNPYHLSVTVQGFTPYAQDVDVRSVVPVALNISLTVSSSYRDGNRRSRWRGSAGKHFDLSHRRRPRSVRQTSARKPVVGSEFARHPRHARHRRRLQRPLPRPRRSRAKTPSRSMASPSPTSRAKSFPTRFRSMPFESLEVISGAPPAEFGDKTSVVINVTTRSGQGLTTPQGAVTAPTAASAPSNVGFNLGYGGDKWGNFISVERPE